MYQWRVDHVRAAEAAEDVRLSDEQALRASLDGDVQAFGVLVERYQEVAFRAAYLVTRDAGAAEDVCQEAFLRAHGHLGRFRLGEPFRPWLLRIVTNQAKNHVRSRGRREGLLARLRPRAAEVASGPEREVEAAERKEQVLEAMNRLSLEDREVLYLRHFLDLPEREIAEVIGKRPGTVKSRLSRARGRLRTVIEERYPALAAEEMGMTDA
ncbi:MAG: sigma-70 family RNA polymerase sigma factor [Dehalococcoidia bacterium]|nr:sigma-70 family RNA polymerase sigma factor [Dehalococcoidia bacterium]